MAHVIYSVFGSFQGKPSGRQPLRGLPNDLFQKPAAGILNVIHAVKLINGIFLSHLRITQPGSVGAVVKEIQERELHPVGVFLGVLHWLFCAVLFVIG